MVVRTLCLFALVLSGSAFGQDASPDRETAVVEATSLLGAPLTRLTVDEPFRGQQLRAVAALRARLSAGPNDPDARVWLGRRLGYLGHYGEAIEVFSEGMARHPADARFPRHRGHRLLSTRRIAEAAADFEHGLDLIAGRPDGVEPDGLPNLFNRPTGTRKTNLWYHLGLARYLEGDFVRASEAFQACAALSDNPDMLVAATYWLFLSLERSGRGDDAARALERVPTGVALIENDDYLRLVDLFRDAASADDLLAVHRDGTLGSATVGYGVGAWHLIRGRTAEARALFEHLTAGDSWSAFGFISAEAELARMRASDR